MVKQNRCYKAQATLKRGGIWLLGQIVKSLKSMDIVWKIQKK